MTTTIFIIVLLHLIAGFGYILYKLQPQKKKVENHARKTVKN